ncbi:hypothetical protein EXIGLDRAFT_607721 [Exidia glandulosa HHB12029]|uniref:DUF4218 domain-containing protein n=1 Tax=Exidia glandulosa HHB12029 TaxID=1314781 RepID=A0A165LDP7_EXIGL|nr:hypothetical protein EXIGLDRAFT_607721 [Exidia glandulosa HHB12029]
MHLFWLNLIRLLIALYTGDFKGFSEGSERYEFTRSAWEVIGRATQAAGDTVPGAFGRCVPDLAEDKGYRTAEMWAVWTLYIAGAVLKGRFRAQKFYTHFIQLVHLISLSTQLSITSVELSQIRLGFIDWVEKFERWFYQYNPERLPMCTSIVHYLLHIADSIEAQGPLWVYWSFVMERHCRILLQGVRSRKHPWASLDNFVLDEAHLQSILSTYNVDRDYLQVTAPQRQAASFQCKNYPNCKLLPPHKVIAPNTHLCSQIATALAVWYAPEGETEAQRVSRVRRIKARLPEKLEEWGKVRRLDGGNTMHASEVCREPAGTRDMSFIRYEQMVDIYAHQRNRDPVFERRTFYGQLQRIIVLAMSPLARELACEPEPLIFAAIKECSEMEEPNAAGLQFYKDLKGVELTNLATVECVFGRVSTHDKKWAIVDRSDVLSRVLFTEEDATVTASEN